MNEKPRVINLQTYVDQRGSLTPVLEQIFTGTVCIKQSVSKQGVIRGFHWQKMPYYQNKFIFVTQGSIRDVCIRVCDGHLSSDVYSFDLSSESKQLLFIPGNFAHGFQCISQHCTIMYICEGEYNEEHEMTYHPLKHYNDWPIHEKIISDKDLEGF